MYNMSMFYNINLLFILIFYFMQKVPLVFPKTLLQIYSVMLFRISAKACLYSSLPDASFAASYACEIDAVPL